jgi:hypothetical protein
MAAKGFDNYVHSYELAPDNYPLMMESPTGSAQSIKDLRNNLYNALTKVSRHPTDPSKQTMAYLYEKPIHHEDFVTRARDNVIGKDPHDYDVRYKDPDPDASESETKHREQSLLAEHQKDVEAMQQRKSRQTTAPKSPYDPVYLSNEASAAKIPTVSHPDMTPEEHGQQLAYHQKQIDDEKKKRKTILSRVGLAPTKWDTALTTFPGEANEANLTPARQKALQQFRASLARQAAHDEAVQHHARQAEDKQTAQGPQNAGDEWAQEQPDASDAWVPDETDETGPDTGDAYDPNERVPFALKHHRARREFYTAAAAAYYGGKA